MASGFQEFWTTGSRAYFQREGAADDDGNEYPFEDLGVIEVVSPEVTPAEISLKDSDGGLKRTVDTRITEISESYKIKCSNLNLDNLSRLFLSEKPSDPGWGTATEYTVEHNMSPGRLVKLKDSDAVLRYSIDAVAGLYIGTVTSYVVSDIIKSSKTIKITGDHHSDAGLQAGKKIIVKKAGLTEIKNSRTYTVASIAYSSTTNIVVVEEPEADETSITGALLGENSGTVYGQDTDWEVASLDRGFIRVIDGGDIDEPDDVTVVFTAGAIEGERQLIPQGLFKQLRGKMVLFWGQGNNADQTVREFTVVMAPNAANFQVDNYSDITFDCKVLADPTSDTPAGKLVKFKGDLPTLS